MHIIYVTPEFVTESKGGGLASYISNIARIMTERGHDVTIITESEKNNDSIIWNDGIVVERVKKRGKKLLIPVYTLLQSWLLCKRVKKVHRQRRADIVQYASFEAVGFFYYKKIPAVLRISSDCVCWRKLKIFDYRLEDIEKCCLTDRIEYSAIRKIKQIYGPSRATAALIERRVQCPVTVIESPFYLNRDDYDYCVYESRLKGRKYYLSHSSMSCLKGTHIIAQVIRRICEMDREAHFVFVGSDHGILYRDGRIESVKDYILREAGEYAERVIFLEPLERKQLYPIVENAFACLMPSRIDNMPNTCIEAMAMGKIVIGTKGASFEQLITDGESGFLIEIEDSEGLIDAIEKMNALEPGERNQIERNAKRVTDRFNAEETYRQVINYYGKIIEKAGK